MGGKIEVAILIDPQTPKSSKRYLLFLILFAFFAAGCQFTGVPEFNKKTSPSLPAEITQTLTASDTPAHVVQTSETATKSLSPTSIVNPTATRTPTTTPLPTFTPYPQPNTTLSADNAAQIRQLERLGKGGITSLAFSPDGRYLVAGTTIGISIQDTQSWEEIFIELESSVIAVEFSPAGDILSIGLGNGTIQLWNVPQWSIVRTLVHDTVAPLVVEKNYASGYYIGLEYRQNVGGYATVLAFSPDGSLLASAGWGRSIHFWRVSDGTLQKTIETDRFTVYIDDIAFSPDGKSVAIVDGDITLWQIENWEKLYQIKEYRRFDESYGEFFNAISFKDEGELLVGWSGEVLVIWQLTDGRIIRSFNIPGISFVQHLSSDGKKLAIVTEGFEESALEIWDTTSATKKILNTNHPDLISHVIISPDKEIVVASSRDGNLQILDISENEIIQTVGGFYSGIDNVLLLPDNSEFAILQLLYEHPIMNLYNLENGAVIKSVDLNSFDAHFDSQFIFSPDGTILAVAGENLQLWNFETGKMLKTLWGEGGYPTVQDVSFMQDGTVVAYSTYGKVKVVELLGNNVQVFEQARGPMCFLPGDKTLVTSGREIQYWDLASGERIQQIQFGAYGPWATFSSNCDMFSMMSWDGYFKVLQNLDGQYGVPVNVFDLRTDNIYLLKPVAFSPNRDLLAVQEAIGKIRIFNLLTGKTVTVLEGHKDGISSLNFTTDGRLLISSSGDGTIRLWGINP
jgi:WD40 repeat protein